jgi:2-C-methyl-D-erythritol 4-phosphate cytidylyltransferase
METIAILVAAGRGERMGAAQPKAFLPLAGESLLLRSARAFDQTKAVDAIIVVVPAGSEEATQDLLMPIAKLHTVIPGGARRQDSVLAGLKSIPPAFEGVVLVHDAARPFVTVALIEEVVREARGQGAALPVLDLVDTIKRVRGGRVVETLDRTTLGAAQTPQGFRFRLLLRAYEEAFRADTLLTDEAMAVERLGASVVAVKGSVHNRKLTTPADLVWAEQLLRETGEGE